MCSDAPDTSGMNAAAVANADIGREQLAMARNEAAKAEVRQAKFDPKFEEILNSSLASQKLQDDRSAQQWDQYTSTFMPAESKLAATAMNYDTAGRRDEAGDAARAAVEVQGNNAREAQTRSLGRAGISLSSGRALALDDASRLQQSKLAVGADAAARRTVEATGLSMVDNVVKTGRGLASTGLQAASLALSAGGTAGNTMGQNQSTYNASMAPAMGAYSGASNAYTQSGQMFGQIADQEAKANATAMSGLSGLGSLAGTLGAAGMTGGGSVFGSMISSKTMKHRLGPVSGKAARLSLEGAPVERWKYKKGVADEDEHIGRYAEDIPGGPMGGKGIDVISELGLHHAALSDISKELRRVSSKLTLASRNDNNPGKRRMSLADAANDKQKEVA